jgi:peptidoglycan/LPS O-acetylase OafA/YrhL
MESKNIGYIGRLDHLRFLAALMVIMYHGETWFPADQFQMEFYQLPMFHWGYVGVFLFMAISGFILSVITDGKDIDVKRFYLNRFLRIYPLFALVVTLGYFATPDPRPPETGLHYLLSLLPISNLYRLHYGQYGGAMFTVAIELQFYLLFPFLLLMYRRVGLRYFIALFIFLFSLRVLVYRLEGNGHDFAYFSIFGAIDIFLIGFLAGQWYLRNPNWKAQWWMAPALLLLGNVMIWGFYNTPALAWRQKFLWIVWLDFNGVVWAALIVTYLRSNIRLPGSSALSYLGKISFSLYAWHSMIFWAIPKWPFFSLTPNIATGLVILPITIAFSALSFYIIEAPFLSLRKKYVADLRAA